MTVSLFPSSKTPYGFTAYSIVASAGINSLRNINAMPEGRKPEDFFEAAAHAAAFNARLLRASILRLPHNDKPIFLDSSLLFPQLGLLAKPLGDSASLKAVYGSYVKAVLRELNKLPKRVVLCLSEHDEDGDAKLLSLLGHSLPKHVALMTRPSPPADYIVEAGKQVIVKKKRRQVKTNPPRTGVIRASMTEWKAAKRKTDYGLKIRSALRRGVFCIFGS